MTLQFIKRPIQSLLHRIFPEAPIEYPKTADYKGDLYDLAYKWGWEQSRFKDLVYLCYKTPNIAENAQRFADSKEFAEELVLLKQQGLKPGDRVLDFGCGNGIASYALAKNGFKVIGYEASQGEIAGIKAAEKLIGLDGVSFEVKLSTGWNLDFKDQSFDAVWIREALHHVSNLKDFLTEVKRVLKPNGILVCWREVVIANEQQRKEFFDTHPFYPITQDEGCFYLKEYYEAFEAALFELVKELKPDDSFINSYPEKLKPGSFNQMAFMQSPHGYALYSFVLRNKELNR